MSFSRLPVVDLRSSLDDVHQSLLLASTTTSFFYLANHGLNAVQNRMFTLAKKFFHLPLSEKLAYAMNSTSYNGYARMGRENLDSTNSQLVDEKEAFKIGQSDLNENKLPKLFSEDENFHLVVEFFRMCYDLCMRLLEHLAEAFGIDQDYFTSRHRWEKEPGNTLKLLHYPPTHKTKHDTNVIRAVGKFFLLRKEHDYSLTFKGAHSDYGSITLLFQHENKSGLEVFDRSSSTWHPVEARDDMVVVNFGDVFEYWSNGLIKSTIHRVNLPGDDQQNDARFSIAFFSDPNGDTRLTPIPSKLIENRVYAKDEHANHIFTHSNEHILTAGEHLRMRLSNTHKK